MKNRDCSICIDLLPSYIDGLTSEESNKFIEDHLSKCKDCKRTYDLMKNDGDYEETNKKSIDYLKKVRKKNKAIGLVSGVIILLLILSFIYMKPNPIEDIDLLSYDVQMTDENVLLTYIRLRDRNKGIYDLDYTIKNDNLYIKPIVTNSNILGSNEKSFTYKIIDNINDIYLGDKIVYSKGVKIPKIVSELYNSKIEYLGDTSGTLDIVNKLNLEDIYGNYKIELLTSKKPYRLKINFNIKTDREYYDNLRRNAYVLYNLIGNLQEVEFDFTDGNFIFSEKTLKDPYELKAYNSYVEKDSILYLQRLMLGLNIYYEE